MKRVGDDPRYKQALAECDGDTWFAKTIVAPKIEAEIIAANEAAFLAEWRPVFAERRQRWNDLVKSEPTLTVPQREKRLGFTMRDLATAKKMLEGK